MPRPTPDHLALAASMTSSGFTDGLGRRALGFDREAGTMLERLMLRPELAAFEGLLRERLERLATTEDERIARPGWIEHDPNGVLVVVSEFVPGARLSDLLDSAVEEGAAPGLDAAFGFLLDVLPALCGLHAAAGFAHGTIAPSRTVVTPAGQVVLLDGIYGGALSLLRYSPRKLWSDFGIAVPGEDHPSRLDTQTDIGQAALAAVMLILGRPLYEDEFPEALSRVIADAVEVAQIRGGPQFAGEFQTFLQRALPLPERWRYATADDALIDLRALAGHLGIDVCRRALVEFINQKEPTSPAAQHDEDEVLATIASYGALVSMGTIVDFEVLSDADEEDDTPQEAEIDLEALVEAPQNAFEGESEHDVVLGASTEGVVAPEAGEPPGQPADSGAAAAEPTASAGDLLDVATVSGGEAPLQDESLAGAEASGEGGQADHPGVVVEAQPATQSVRSRRAKRTRSARARKDKLRSAAMTTPLATQRAGENTLDVESPHDGVQASTREPRRKGAEGWLVNAGRAQSFEPVVTSDPPAPQWPPKPVTPAIPVPGVTPPPSIVPFTPPAAVQPPPLMPAVNARVAAAAITPSVTGPSYVPPAPWSQPLPAPPLPQLVQPAEAQSVAPTLPTVGPLKLKDPPPKPRSQRAVAPPDEIHSAPSLPATEPKRVFPWKLAAAAIVGVAIVIAAGRLYHATEVKTSSEPAESMPLIDSRLAPGSSAVAEPTRSAAIATKAAAIGRLEIETQPAGARVLLDGKAMGESPLVLESVPVGRHTVTLTSPSGTVRRTIRIEANRTLKVDVPIFSGWAGIFAPFVVVVSEGDRVIGTTEESRIMLSPGRHVLTLTNQELGYRSVETVDIEPGEVRTISLDPRGTVNLNASPWAEIWIDGKKAGDTPLAGLQLPLGTQEVSFRHPKYGERRVTVTVKGNQPAALSVDMVK